MTLVKKGLIKLDHDVNEYLVSWKVPENSFTKNEKVTIRRLLSHTSGLTDRNGFPGYQQGMPLPSLIEILQGNSPKVNSPQIIVGMKPGSFWQYSGGGYEILQLLIEDVTHLPFEKYMKETILVPLGMTHSTFEYPLPEGILSQAASAHLRKAVVKGKHHVYPEKGAAALWTTPADLAKMVISVSRCAQGIRDERGLSGILGAELCREMLTMRKWPRDNGRTKGMGLGFMIDEQRGVKVFSHGGSNEGFQCDFRGILSDNGLNGTVIMSNSSRGGSLINELEKTIDDVYGWEAYKPLEKKIADIKLESLKKWVGTSYTSDDKTTLVIEREGHLAMIDMLDHPPQPLDIFPESENLFFDPRRRGTRIYF